MSDIGFPSNKPVSGPKTKQEKEQETPITKENISLKLDKLSVTYPIKNEETQEAVRQALMMTAKLGYPYANAHVPRSRYKVNVKIALSETANVTALVQAQPKKAGDAYFRVEWNPDKAGPEGNDLFKVELETLLPVGYDELLAYGRVSRIDVALDILGVNINELQFLPKSPLKTTLFLDTKGCIETLYLGSRKSKTFWRIYDKAREVKHHGGKLSGEWTRLERVLRTNRHFTKLPSIPNPFTYLSVVGFGSAPKGVPDHEWKLFIFASRAIGVNAALAVLPKKKRSAYRSALKANAASWWEPKMIWAAWPVYLNDLGLLTGFHTKSGPKQKNDMAA